MTILACAYGPDEGLRRPLWKDVYLLGRARACDIKLTDGAVSRFHCRLVRRADGKYVVEDLNSTNGVRVRKGWIHGTARAVDHGELFGLGSSVFVIRHEITSCSVAVH